MTKKKPDAALGRPRKDAIDQLVVDLAAALMENMPLGPQEARDLALAWLEGTEATPTKLPRGARKRAVPGSVLAGYELPAIFEGRTEAIRRKHLEPRPVVVTAFSRLLRALVSKDTAAMVRAFGRLMRTK